MTPPAEEPERPRVLMLEDSEADAALIRRWLLKAATPYELRWVKTREEFESALVGYAPDLVLSDYKMSSFDGMSALVMVQEKAPQAPFILISGTIGEVMAVEALKSGATDYVLKDHLERLEGVMTRALRERSERMERRAAEAALLESRAQLIQSQKMEALGRLSGGVAHDFNNILTAITGYTELALLNPKLEADLRADLQEILNAAFRAAALTRQLLAFSRRQVFTPKILDLNHTLAELDRMLQRIIGEDVKLVIVPDPAICRVRVDADQIGQVVVNIIVNARDAMPTGGTITMRTANVELDESALRAQPDVRPGRFVRVSIEDTGAGMDAETLSRIFEPFFTTKSKDKGTGLGLATVYGIIKQSGGFIEVSSRPGYGSVFRLHLPCVEGELDAERAPASPASLRGSETVLVVDDDAAVGLITRRILESRGYTVFEARGGEEALRRCGGPAGPPDLVLTDVVMAGMGGQELARRLQAASPGCKVLFASGYAEGEAAELAGLNENFIAKPYTVADLIKKVRQILDAPPS